MMNQERRDKGTGSIFERNGKLIARYRWKDELGRDKEKSFSCATQKEAEKKLREFRDSLLKGEVSISKVTTGEFFEKALEEIYRPKLRPSTYRLYKMFNRMYVVDLHKVKLSDLKTLMIERVIAEAKPSKKGVTELSGQTKALLRRFIITTLNHAVRLGYIKENPAEKTLAVQVQARKVKSLSPEDAKEILDNTSNLVYKGIFASQLLMGLRIGEACGWKRDSTEGSWLAVNSQIQRVVDEKTGKSKKQEQDLKTENAERVLQIPPQLALILGSLPRTGPYVFSTSKGTPIEPRMAQRALDATVKRINAKRKAEEKELMKHVTTHQLRHTWATLQVRMKTDINVVSLLLGHGDIRTTMIYLDMDQETQTGLNEKVGELLAV